MPQVPGYLKTQIIHSFLTILNYKTVCECPSSIMDRPSVPNQPKTFEFPQRTFGQKNPVKKSFQSSWFANRMWLHYNEGLKGKQNRVLSCMQVAYRDRKLTLAVRILNLDLALLVWHCRRTLKGSLEQDYLFVWDSCLRWFMGVNNKNIVHSKSRLP